MAEEVTFPRRRLLRCLEDPHLYFMMLPRDILQFCLRPYLEHLVTLWLCDEDWIEPILVKTLTVPCKLTSRNHVFLQGGHCLIFEPRKVTLVDFHTGQIRWTAEGSSFNSGMNNIMNDEFLLQHEANYIHLRHVSQIKTAADFFQPENSISEFEFRALKEQWQRSRPSREQYLQSKRESFRIGNQTHSWAPNSAIPSPYTSHLRTICQQIAKANSSLTYHFGGYCQGYLIMCCFSSDRNPQHLVLFYQCTK